MTDANVPAKIKIYVITFRRPVLLRRALESLLAQTYCHWSAEVLNDDPADGQVNAIINEIADERIFLSMPLVKRGGTANLNYAFQHSAAPYATVLEDDNWLEPEFLEVMLGGMQQRNEIEISVANERIWKEEANGEWTNTGKTIWPVTVGESVFKYFMADKCGRAKICNSSMFWRTGNAKNWLIPDDVPLDVTEHFRERILPHPILLIHRPLVNFSETVQTSRSVKVSLWGSYQVLLIASIFNDISSAKAEELARQLWLVARQQSRPFKTSLLHAGLSVRQARQLLSEATIFELLRYFMTWIRSPVTCFKIINAPRRLTSHWSFLTSTTHGDHSPVSEKES